MTKHPMDEKAEAKRAARAEARRKEELSTKAFLKHFAGHAERGTALSVVAYLDIKVISFLRHVLTDDEKEIGRLMKPEGGLLGNLGGRIRICYALGYLEKRTFEDLKRIVDVRNLFAHEQAADSFSFLGIGKLCQELLVFQNSVEFFGRGDEEEGKRQVEFYKSFGHDLKNHRWGFVAAVGFLSNQFQANQHLPLAIKQNYIKQLF